MSSTGQEPSAVTVENVTALLDLALKSAYRVRDTDSESDNVMKTCLTLFGKDYKYTLLDNSNGELCSQYPSQIVLLEYIKSKDSLLDNVESVYDVSRLGKLITSAKSARCRQRFAAPVLLYDGKHVCRSATISGGAEMYGRRMIDILSGVENQAGSSTSADRYTTRDSEHDRVRGQDIRLLQFFSVSYIFDLMLEMKKVKFGMKWVTVCNLQMGDTLRVQFATKVNSALPSFWLSVTSSEKVDKENRYSDFLLSSIPYPGCEFFRDWKESGYRAEGLVFDWRQGFVDSYLELPSRPSPPQHVDWYTYCQWDLVTLTQNYLKLLIHYLREGEGGMLVHCISGWDRTPLFISLLRLSLWAEGAIHQSLSALEMLYLTVAYDWFLFGHNLPDRLSRGEEIFFFCFDFLQHITSEEFNITHKRHKRTASGMDPDGIVADYDSHVGSSSSVSSIGSTNSTRSGSNDSQPVHFHLAGTDDQTAHLDSMESSIATLTLSSVNGRCRSSPSVVYYASTHRGTSPSSAPTVRHDATCTVLHGTSPVAVPLRSSLPPHVLSSDVRLASSAASCGSWQLVSSTGALPSSASSGKSWTSDQSQIDALRHQSAMALSCHDKTSHESIRQQRLDEVRRTFTHLYRQSLVDNSSSTAGLAASASAQDITTSTTAATVGIISGLLERVGLRAVRSGFV